MFKQLSVHRRHGHGGPDGGHVEVDRAPLHDRGRGQCEHHQPNRWGKLHGCREELHGDAGVPTD